MTYFFSGKDGKVRSQVTVGEDGRIEYASNPNDDEQKDISWYPTLNLTV